MGIKRVNVLTVDPGSVAPSPGLGAANLIYDISTNKLKAVLKGGEIVEVAGGGASSASTASFVDLAGNAEDNASLVNYVADEITSEISGSILYTTGADPFRTTNLSGESISGLTVTCEALTTYDFDAHLRIKSYNSSGVKVVLFGPSGTTIFCSCFGLGSNGTNFLSTNLQAFSTLTTATFITFTAETGWINIRGSFRLSSTPGDVSLGIAPVLTEAGILNLGTWWSVNKRS